MKKKLLDQILANIYGEPEIEYLIKVVKSKNQKEEEAAASVDEGVESMEN